MRDICSPTGHDRRSMNVYSKRPVNFDYIDFLCDMLRLGDLLLEITRRGLGIQSKEPRPRRKSKSLEHFLKLHGEELEHLFRTLCLFVTYYVVEEIRKPLPPNLQDLLNLSPQQLRRFVGNGMLMFALWQLGENREKEKVNREQRNREIGALREKLINELPISAVLEKDNPPRPRRPGQQPDPWGSFILLALSEHIREATDTPKHSTALALIRLWRGQSPEIRQSRQNAEARISGLKKANPSWALDLEWLKKQFHLSLKSQRQTK